MILSMNLVRVNTRLSTTINDWLDDESKETGLSKSALIMIAVEQYYQQREGLKRMGDMSRIMDELEKIKKVLPSER